MLHQRIQVFTRKPGARFHTLKTNETRVKRRALTSQRACGDARARSRTSNGQAWTFCITLLADQILNTAI